MISARPHTIGLTARPRGSRGTRRRRPGTSPTSCFWTKPASPTICFGGMAAHRAARASTTTPPAGAGRPARFSPRCGSRGCHAWIATQLRRLSGWASTLKLAHVARGQTLRIAGVFDGAIDGESFRAYIEQILVPTLHSVTPTIVQGRRQSRESATRNWTRASQAEAGDPDPAGRPPSGTLPRRSSTAAGSDGSLHSRPSGSVRGRADLHRAADRPLDVSPPSGGAGRSDASLGPGTTR